MTFIRRPGSFLPLSICLYGFSTVPPIIGQIKPIPKVSVDQFPSPNYLLSIYLGQLCCIMGRIQVWLPTLCLKGVQVFTANGGQLLVHLFVVAACSCCNPTLTKGLLSDESAGEVGQGSLLRSCSPVIICYSVPPTPAFHYGESKWKGGCHIHARTCTCLAIVQGFLFAALWL